MRLSCSIHLWLAPTVLSSDAKHVSTRLPPSVREFRSLISGTTESQRSGRALWRLIMPQWFVPPIVIPILILVLVIATALL